MLRTNQILDPAWPAIFELEAVREASIAYAKSRTPLAKHRLKGALIANGVAPRRADDAIKTIISSRRWGNSKNRGEQ